MKRIITLAAAVALLIGMAATPSMAADASLSADIASSYVWRGLTFNDGMVLQPSIDVAGENGFGVNVWGNFDLDDYDFEGDGTLEIEDNEFSEVDLTVYYGTSVGKLDVGVGIIEYLFPTTDVSGGTATTELYLSLGYPIVGGLSAALDMYYDVDALGELAYVALSVAYAYDVNDKMGLELGASMGYAGEDFSKGYDAGNAGANEDSGLYDYTVSASLSYTINDAWSAGAFVTYVGSLDDDNLDDAPTGGLDTEFFGGVSVGYAF